MEHRKVVSKSVKLEIFPSSINIFIGDTFADVENYIADNKLDIAFDYSSQYIALTKADGPIINMIFTRVNLLSNLVHESLHAACEVLHYAGADISYANQESIAYIQQFIFNTFLELIQNEQNSNIQSDCPGTTTDRG